MAQFSMEIMRLTGSVLRGNQHRKAVGAFQMASGLPETGDLDPATVARLRSLIEKAAA